MKEGEEAVEKKLDRPGQDDGGSWSSHMDPHFAGILSNLASSVSPGPSFFFFFVNDFLVQALQYRVNWNHQQQFEKLPPTCNKTYAKVNVVHP